MRGTYATAIHSFLSMPGAVPAARVARAEILARLRTWLTDGRAAESKSGTGARP